MPALHIGIKHKTAIVFEINKKFKWNNFCSSQLKCSFFKASQVYRTSEQLNCWLPHVWVTQQHLISQISSLMLQEHEQSSRQQRKWIQNICCCASCQSCHWTKLNWRMCKSKWLKSQRVAPWRLSLVIISKSIILEDSTMKTETFLTLHIREANFLHFNLGLVRYF